MNYKTINFRLISNQTFRSAAKIEAVKRYLDAVGMIRDFTNAAQNPEFSEVHELDLSEVVPSLSGPKRPHDR